VVQRIFRDAEETLRGIREGSLVVVDIRPFSKYARAHIPGALWLYFWDFTEHERGMPSKPKDPSEIAKILGRNGLSREDRVVIAYDRTSIGIACYTYWYLEYMGQEEIYLLKGGMEEWEARKLPLERGVTKPQPKEYRPIIRSDIRSSLEEVVRIARGEDQAVLIDVRTYEEHIGSMQTTPRPGRIPGSVLIDPMVFLRALFGDGEAVERLSSIAGAAGNRRIITYCSSGERAALAWLVLKKIKGLSDVRLYPESFYEYSSRKDLPVEVGPPRS